MIEKTKPYDLSQTSLISFEINNDCNLKDCHPQCPINIRHYRKKDKALDVDTVVACIRQAKRLQFNGYVTFHNYNEPLLCKEKILDIIDKAPDTKYLLWTNGLLLDRDVEKNGFLKKIDLVYISCYDSCDMPFFEKIQLFHPGVHVEFVELDDRLDTYTRKHVNELGCKRPFFDFPIDYYGNVHMCCFDWDNEYEIGNIFDTSLEEIVLSPQYQKLLEQSKRRLIDPDMAPDICKRCDKPWITYTKYFDVI
ncbi:MAG: SPASM domain-containing protein [Clostridiales bacterium]|jgi:radical SAM protein with 4Fe4S-binding SPASM domain|nr:SPASM domain-containing protein [Clostridiales bacterium]